MECWVSSTEINSIDFVLPLDQHVPAIIDQNNAMFRRSAAALDGVLSEVDYLVENRFSVTDIIVGYTLNFAEEQGLLSVSKLMRLYGTVVRPRALHVGASRRAQRRTNLSPPQHTGRASQTSAFCL